MKVRIPLLAALAAPSLACPLPTPAAERSTAPSRAAITAAADYSSASGGRALLVFKEGRLLLERYGNGHAPSERWKIFSGTKTFWTAAALASRAEGLLDLDEPAARTLSEWAGTPKERITLRQLLECASGIAPHSKLHRKEIPDRNRIAIQLPLVAKPGTRFIYGPSGGQAFLEVLKRKLRARGQSPMGCLREKVLDPIGIGDFPHRPDGRGMPLWASGFELTAREWAAFGQALLKAARGVQGPLALGDFSEALRPSKTNRAFGLCFWLNAAANHPLARVVDVEDELDADWQKQNWRMAALSKTAPPDLFAAIGSYGQRLYIIPSAGLVIVRLGQGRDFHDAPFLDRLFGGGVR